MNDQTDIALPALRDELQFLPAGDDGDGTRGFLIFDPVQNKYFRIGVEAAQVLAGWGAGKASTLVAKLKTSGLLISLADVEALVSFVKNNNLTMTERGGSASLIDSRERQKKSLLVSGLHNYLFF